MALLNRTTSVLFAVLACGGVLLCTPVRAQPGEPLPLGSSLPSINEPLQRISGTSARPTQLTGSVGTVFLFWSNQCPWVDKYEDRVQALVEKYSGEGIQFVLVNANDVDANPNESLEASRKRAQERGYQSTYVRDASARFARALGASRTPHAFVFDESNTLVYVGSIDDSPGDPSRVENAYLRQAVASLVEGSDIPVSETKAFGCSLKYPE